MPKVMPERSRPMAVEVPQALIESRLLAVRGRLETADGVRHLIAGHLEDLTPLPLGLDIRSRDVH